jgi:hypothetical protein
MPLHRIPALEKRIRQTGFINMSAAVWNDLVRPGIIAPAPGWGRLLEGRK